MQGSRFGAEKGDTGVPIYNLPLDLGRIDGVGRIGGVDDSVNFDLVSARDGEFRRCRDVGFERLRLPARKSSPGNFGLYNTIDQNRSLQ